MCDLHKFIFMDNNEISVYLDKLRWILKLYTEQF